MKPSLATITEHFARVHDLHARKHFLESIGFQYINSGGYKECYKHHEWEYVVKLFHYEGDADAKLEVKNYDCAPDDIKPYLVPIHAWGDSYHVQLFVASVHPCHMYSDCPACKYPDMQGKNHVHDAAGRPHIYDYGINKQWAA